MTKKLDHLVYEVAWTFSNDIGASYSSSSVWAQKCRPRKLLTRSIRLKFKCISRTRDALAITQRQEKATSKLSKKRRAIRPLNQTYITRYMFYVNFRSYKCIIYHFKRNRVMGRSGNDSVEEQAWSQCIGCVILLTITMRCTDDGLN